MCARQSHSFDRFKFLVIAWMAATTTTSLRQKTTDYENYLLNSSRESRWQQKRFGLKIWYSHWNHKPWIRNLSLEDEEELTFRVANAYRQHNFQRGGALADSVGEAIMRSCNITRVQVRQAFSWLYMGVVWESGSPSYSPTTTTDSESDSNSTDSYDCTNAGKSVFK